MVSEAWNFSVFLDPGNNDILFPIAWVRGVWPGNPARLLSIFVSRVRPPSIGHCPADFRKDMQVWSERDGYIFQASRQPPTLLWADTPGVSKQHEASKGYEMWAWRKTPAPIPWTQPRWGGKEKHTLPSLLFWPGCCVPDQHTASCLSLVRSSLITTRWHCRLKWNTTNLFPAPRWGSGIPHLGLQRTSISICSFYRWWHWGSETGITCLGSYSLEHKSLDY